VFPLPSGERDGVRGAEEDYLEVFYKIEQIQRKGR